MAIPLADRGCSVTALDASPDMLGILSSKDPDHKVQAILADMADPRIDGEFDLIFAVYNALYELPDQDLQARCVAAAARLLRPGGAFVIEAGAPNRLHTAGPPVITFSFKDLTTVVLRFVEYDHLTQIAEYRHVFLGADGVQVMPTVHRYIYLPELDLMATIAGLELADRYSDWNRARFDSQSPGHVSVYVKSPYVRSP